MHSLFMIFYHCYIISFDGIKVCPLRIKTIYKVQKYNNLFYTKITPTVCTNVSKSQSDRNVTEIAWTFGIRWQSRERSLMFFSHHRIFCHQDGIGDRAASAIVVVASSSCSLEEKHHQTRVDVRIPTSQRSRRTVDRIATTSRLNMAFLQASVSFSLFLFYLDLTRHITSWAIYIERQKAFVLVDARA